MKRLLSILISMFMLFAIIVPTQSIEAIDYVSGAVYSGMKIKVGLYYGSNVLSSANLQNVTGKGSGYRFGFYDTNRNFIPLGQISNVEITMKVISSPHVQLPSGFMSYDEANMYAQSVGGYVAYAGNSFYVRKAGYSNYSEAASAANSCGGTVAGMESVCITDTNSGTVLFGFDVSGANLAIEPLSNSNETPVTWFKTRQYEGGFEYVRSASNLTVINVIDLESYVKGVVPYEMSKSWPLEALKAQAMAARTYTVKNINGHKNYGFDLCNTVDCQVYRGCESRNENTDAAVDQTRGRIITYNYEPINAVYHASNGGATENCENVWTSKLPYLRAVADDFEATTNMSHKSWNYEVTNAQLTDILKARGNNISDIVKAYAVYTDAGNIKELHFIDSNGKELTYDGEMTRIVLKNDTYNIATSSQRFIFEDKYNPRVTSPAEFAKPASSLSVATPNAPILSYAYNTFVVSSFNVLNLLSNKYGEGNIKVLSSDGITTTDAIYSMGVGGIAGATSSSSGIVASTLKTPTSFSGTYIISGSGNGHNLGMSQYGAKAMAEQGYTADQIISHYYTGVQIISYY